MNNDSHFMNEQTYAYPFLKKNSKFENTQSFVLEIPSKNLGSKITTEEELKIIGSSEKLNFLIKKDNIKNVENLKENNLTIAEFYEILFGNDIEKNYNFDCEFKEIKDSYELLIQRNISKDSYFLCLKEKPSLKSILNHAQNSYDNYPLLCLRKYFWLSFNVFSYFSMVLVKSLFFEILSISLMIIQILSLVNAKRVSNTIDLNLTTITYINIYYLVELLLKITGFGLYSNKNSFLKNPINIYDSIIILHDLMCYFFSLKNEIWLFPLRCLTIISKIKILELKKILMSIFLSLKLTGQVFFIVLLFCFIYSLFGLYLFSGLFKMTCYDPLSGFVHPDHLLCGNLDCPSSYVCGKLIDSLYDVDNFDNLLFSFMLILKVLTLDNWNSLQNLCQQTYTNYIWIYYFSFIFFGNFFLINILLAVQKISYSEMMEKTGELKDSLKNVNDEYNLKEFRGIKEQNDQENINKENNQIKKHEPSKPSTFNTANSKINNFRLSKIHPAESQNSKDFNTRNNKSNFLFRKVSQKFNDITFDEGSRPSIKFYDPKNSEKNATPSKKNEEITHLKVKFKTKKGWVPIKKVKKLIFKVIGCFLKTIFHIIAWFLPDVKEGLEKKNLMVFVLEDKKYFSSSIEDVLPLKKEMKLLAREKKLKTYKKIRTCLHYNFEEHLHSHFTDSSFQKTTTIKIMAKKNNKIKKKIAVGLRFFRKNMIKKTFVTQNKTLNLKSILSSKNMSLSKFSKVQPLKNILVPQKSLVKEKLRKLSRKRTLPVLINKKKIETNLYVDVATLNYERIQEIINMEIDEIQQKDFNYKKNYLNYKEIDIKTKKISIDIWSGENVLPYYDCTKSRITNIFESLNATYQNLKFFKKPITILKLETVQLRIKSFVNSICFHYFFAMFTLCSTINFSLEGILSEETYNEINAVSTIFFSIESIVKLIGLGPMNYVRSKENVIDLIITMYMLIYNLTDNIQMITEQIPSFRLLRAFIIFRAFKIFKGFSYFEVITNVVKESFYSFFYIALIIFLFLFVFSLLGLQMFFNLLRDSKFETSSKSFNGLFESFMSVFVIMTLDNYSDIFVYSWHETNKFYLTLFLIAIIFVGNMFLLNLFITVLLDGFDKISQEKKKGSFQANNTLSLQSFFEENDVGSVSIRSFSKNQSNVSELSNDNKKNHQRKSFKIDNEEVKNKFTNSLKNGINFDDEEFEKIEENYSLFIFSKTNFIRILCFKMKKNIVFKILIDVVIIFSIVYMALLTFIPITNNNLIDFSVKLFINSILILDTSVMIIIYGFIMRKKSFMRNIFNVMDLIVLIVYILDVFTSAPDSINVLYILRVFRIYKLLYSVKEIKVILESLVLSLSGILSLFVFVLFTWTIFGMIGIILFRGRFGYCRKPTNYNIGIDSCEDGWIVFPFNFDNIYMALLTLFEVSTFDNWSNILQIAVNSHLSNHGPKPYNNQYSAYFFFISFILFGVWFCINLFIGVLCSNFNEVKKKTQNKYFNTNQMKWRNMQKTILNSEPKQFPPPTQGFKKTLYSFLQSVTFTRFIQIMMILNIFTCSLFTDDESSESKELIDLFTYFITFIYLLEMLMKIVVFGVRGYFTYSEHTFQFFIAITMLLNLFISYGLKPYLTSYIKLSRMFLILKVFGVLRIIGEMPNIKNMLTVVMFSWKYILNIMILLISSYMIFAIIGCNLFPNVHTGKVVNDYVNFKNFFYGLMTLFKCATGDDWGNVMMDLNKTPPNCIEDVDCGSQFATLYFVIFMLWTNIVLQNLFILAIFDTFEDYFVNKDKALELVANKISQFQMQWPLFCNPGTMEMNVNKIFEFFKALGPPMGFKKNDRLLEMGRNLMQMNILRSTTGNFHFNLLLHGALKHHYYDEIYSDVTKIETLKLLKLTENRFYLALEKKNFKQKSRVKNFLNLGQSKDKEKEQKKEKPSPFNPLPLLLFSSLLFQKWKDYAKSKSNDRKSVKKKSESEAKDKNINRTSSKRSPLNKNDLIECKFEKFNFPKAFQQKEEKNTEREEKSSEKEENSKENDYPNYPCTNKNEII